MLEADRLRQQITIPGATTARNRKLVTFDSGRFRIWNAQHEITDSFWLWLVVHNNVRIFGTLLAFFDYSVFIL